MVMLNFKRDEGMHCTGLIPLKEAAEAMGVNINVLHGRSAPAQIRKYIHNKGTNNQLFDINGYKREKDEELEIIEKTTLFIEYLFHIEEIDYSKMHKITKVKKNYITTLNFSFRTSLRFLKRICEHDDTLIQKFCDFYDFGTRFDEAVFKYCLNRKDV